MSFDDLRQYGTNEVVGARVNFLLASLAKIEGLPGVKRDFCKLEMTEKAPCNAPPNCAVLP